jgi:hypothetical protein
MKVKLLRSILEQPQFEFGTFSAKRLCLKIGEQLFGIGKDASKLFSFPFTKL